jgi:hypothetical protein
MNDLPQLLHAHAIRLRVTHPNLDTATIEYFLREGAQIATERAAITLQDLRQQMTQARRQVCPAEKETWYQSKWSPMV